MKMKFAALLAAALLASPVPIVAKKKDDAQQGSTAAKPKKICRVDPSTTGSRMPKRICKTQDQWDNPQTDVKDDTRVKSRNS